MTESTITVRTAAYDAQLLRIYLEDHLAGGEAGTRRAHRLAEAEQDGPDGETLTKVADEIEFDLASLRAVIDHLGVTPRAHKRWLARAAELAGLLKLNGRLFRRSPLTTLVEVEMMLAAVRGKLALWNSLRATFGANLGPVDLDDLADRAHSQLDDLSAVHQRAAVATLGTHPTT